MAADAKRVKNVGDVAHSTGGGAVLRTGEGPHLNSVEQRRFQEEKRPVQGNPLVHNAYLTSTASFQRSPRALPLIVPPRQKIDRSVLHVTGLTDRLDRGGLI